MPNHPLFFPVYEPFSSAALCDRVQIALALADAFLLKSLLTDCLPAISAAHLIGEIGAEVSVPTGDRWADGVLHYEAMQCQLAEHHGAVNYQPESHGWTRDSKAMARLTQCESETHLLAENVGLAPLIALLKNAGFCPQQIEAILHLPQDTWHKSWWYALDEQQQFTMPFLRTLRVRRYTDGTFSAQYKDYFEQDKPACFRSQQQQVQIKIKPDNQSFGTILGQLKHTQGALGLGCTILICHTISDLEAQAFINQGIHVYPAAELLLPTRSHCGHCARQACPMNGLADSPVAMCYGFLPA
jgi:bacterioferritin-associated ferredoxin